MDPAKKMQQKKKVISKAQKRKVIHHMAACECMHCLLRRVLKLKTPWYEDRNNPEHQEVLNLTPEEIARGPEDEPVAP